MISTQPDDRGRGIGEIGLPEVLLEVKLSPQSKPPRGKPAERGVDDPSGRCPHHNQAQRNRFQSGEGGSLKGLYLAKQDN